MNSGPNTSRRSVRNRLVFWLLLLLTAAAAAQTTAPSRRLPKIPVVNLSIDAKSDEGPLEFWRHTLGHGGVNSNPLSPRVIDGTKQLHPRLIRIFIQEFFNIYPDHGKYDWSKLDPYMDSFAATGAKVVAAITIKPKVLYPRIDQKIWRPNNVEEWQQVIAALVKRYSIVSLPVRVNRSVKCRWSPVLR